MNKHNVSSWPLCSYLVVFLFLAYLLTEGNLLRSLSREDDAKTAHRSGNDESIRKKALSSLREQHGKQISTDLRYCSIGEVVGAEGPVFEGSDDYVLHHLLLNIRHGDRSSIHNIPGAQPLSAQVHRKEKSFLDQRVFQYLPLLSSFVLKSMDESQPSISVKNGEGDILPDALNLSEVFTLSDSDIPPGILTTRGFMQHILLGKHLLKSYRFYLERVTSPQDLYIRSTNYRRTILSVVALMITLVPTLSQHANQKIPIYSYPLESDEIMHGIGLRLSSHLEHGGETSNKGSCERSAYLAAREKANFKSDESNYMKLKGIFGDSIEHMMATDITDSSFPRECHHLPFPCTLDGSSCMSRDMFFVAMNDANRQFCHRYTGQNGGINATRLSIYPFMKEIRDALFSSVTTNQGVKLTIFSGHDTVIAPVLAALGVYQQRDFCVWPPYASRIIFEVYVKNEKPLKTMYDENHARNSVMIRVLYNGEDVTRDITACSLVMSGSSLSLCPLGALEDQISTLISPYDSIDDACKM